MIASCKSLEGKERCADRTRIAILAADVLNLVSKLGDRFAVIRYCSFAIFLTKRWVGLVQECEVETGEGEDSLKKERML
jgi:hypothetical protein